MPAGGELWLIRHAQSTWNAAGRWQGHCDSPLSELGRSQAKELAQRVDPGAVDVLVSSDLERALETARIVGAAIGREPDPDPGFRELDLGAWGGLTRPEIQERWPDVLRRFDADEFDARPAEGETRAELAVRVHAATARVVAENPGRRIAIVTHYGAIQALVPGSWLENAELYRAPLASLELEVGSIRSMPGSGRQN